MKKFKTKVVFNSRDLQIRKLNWFDAGKSKPSRHQNLLNKKDYRARKTKMQDCICIWMYLSGEHSTSYLILVCTKLKYVRILPKFLLVFIFCLVDPLAEIYPRLQGPSTAVTFCNQLTKQSIYFSLSLLGSLQKRNQWELTEDINKRERK